MALGALPVGLTQGVSLRNAVAKGGGEVVRRNHRREPGAGKVTPRNEGRSRVGKMSLRVRPHVRVSEHRVIPLDGRVCRVNPQAARAPAVIHHRTVDLI